MAPTGRQSKWDKPNDSKSNSASASDAARERAARINAMLAAKGKLAKGAPPPLISPSFSVPVNKPVVSLPPNVATQELFSDEVEVNDSPSRVILCKGTTQDEINRYSGAAVSTKGRYMTKEDVEKAKANGTNERPLYLSVQGTSQDKVDLAVKRIKDIMNGADIRGNPPSRQAPPAPPPHLKPHTPPQYNNMHAPPPPEIQQLPPPGSHYLQEKVFVGLDHAPPEFNLNDKLLGPAGCYFQHIATQTGAKLLLRGRGSGFMEPTSGREAFETMYIFITHPRPDGVQAAKSLVENLLQTVHNEFQNFDQMRKSYSGQWCSYNQPPTTQQGSAYPPRYAGPNDQPGYGYDGGPPGPSPRGYGPPPPVPPHFFNHHQPQGPQGPRPTHPSYSGGPAPFPPAGQALMHQGGPPYPPGPDYSAAHSYGVPPPVPPHPDSHMYPHPSSGQPPLPPPPQSVPYSPSQPDSTNNEMPHITQPQPAPVQTSPKPGPRKRRFREQAVTSSGSTVADASSSSAHQHHSPTHNSDIGPLTDMMPPPLPPANRHDERPMLPPPPPDEFMPPPPAVPAPVSFKVPKRSRLQPSSAQHDREAKRVKKDESPKPASGGIASLVAYGDGDSSDEEDDSNYVNVSAKKGGSGKGGQRPGKGNKPFWAVR